MDNLLTTIICTKNKMEVLFQMKRVDFIKSTIEFFMRKELKIRQKG